MNVGRRGFLTGCAVLLSTKGARAGSLDALLARIARARAPVRTLQGPFTQTRRADRAPGHGGSLVLGEMTLVRPDRLRWELAPPDGVTFFVGPEGLAYRSAQGQGRLPATTGRLASALEDLRTVLAGDLFKLRERWDLVVIRDDATGAELEATPRPTASPGPPPAQSVATSLRSIRFALGPSLAVPTRTLLVEGARDKTLIEFGALVTNAAVDETKMRPAPEGEEAAPQARATCVCFRSGCRPCIAPASSASHAGRRRKSTAGGGRATADESALWNAQERAVSRARDAGTAAQRIGSSALRQRASIDSVADRIRALSSLIGDAQAGFARTVDAFERLSLVALNAGLEGARLGEAQGRALALVGDEVRAQSTRGGEAARELSAVLSRLSVDLRELESRAGQAQLVVAELAHDSTAVVGAASDAEAALVELGDRVKKATGSDPEIVRAVAEAAERARALVASLVALSGKVPRALLIGAMGPAILPLTRLLSDEAPDEDDTAR